MPEPFTLPETSRVKFNESNIFTLPNEKERLFRAIA
jgi:hypothetical protein